MAKETGRKRPPKGTPPRWSPAASSCREGRLEERDGGRQRMPSHTVLLLLHEGGRSGRKRSATVLPSPILLVVKTEFPT